MTIRADCFSRLIPALNGNAKRLCCRTSGSKLWTSHGALLAARQGMSRARVRLGEIGEDLAVRELERLGYAILARRYRAPRGEIDIIASDGPAVVFVEVKTREGSAFGSAAEAVTTTKRRRLIETARDYLGRRHWHDGPCRFDVVTIALSEEGPAVEVLRHAFDLTG